jgi:hypothetical protein
MSECFALWMLLAEQHAHDLSVKMGGGYSFLVYLAQQYIYAHNLDAVLGVGLSKDFLWLHLNSMRFIHVTYRAGVSSGFRGTLAMRVTKGVEERAKRVRHTQAAGQAC